MGVSEQSDAVVVVVSEETGAISLSMEGKLSRGLKEEALRQRLLAALQPAGQRPGRNGKPRVPRSKRATRREPREREPV